MNRKGQVFMMLLVFVTLVGLIMLYIAMLSKSEGFDKDIGDRQFEVWKAHSKAENALFYVDLSARLAADRSISDLAAQGGVMDSACGEYFGYPIWISRDTDCTPTKPADAYTVVFDEHLSEYLAKYPGIYIPSSNYEYAVTGNTLVAKARNPIVVPITDIINPPKQTIYSTVEKPAAVQGDYTWPSIYKVITSCKGGRDVKDGSKDHLGIDIRARTGDPVFAAADGTVTAVEPSLGGVRLGHIGSIETRYIHNSQILVQKGDTVTKGQVIARAGAVATKVAHIHFEAKRGGAIIDPIESLYKISQYDLTFSKSANCVYNKAGYSYASLITPERVVA